MKKFVVFSILFAFSIIASVALHASPVELRNDYKPDRQSFITSDVYTVTTADVAFLDAVFKLPVEIVTESSTEVYNISRLVPSIKNSDATIRYKRSMFAGISKLFARRNYKRTGISKFYSSRYKQRSLKCKELIN